MYHIHVAAAAVVLLRILLPMNAACMVWERLTLSMMAVAAAAVDHLQTQTRHWQTSSLTEANS